jgi:hypothetical protein
MPGSSACHVAVCWRGRADCHRHGDAKRISALICIGIHALSEQLLLPDGSILVLARRRAQWDCLECLNFNIQNTSKVMRRPNVLLHVGKTLPPLYSQKKASVRYGAGGAREPEPYQVSRGEKLEDMTH